MHLLRVGISPQLEALLQKQGGYMERQQAKYNQPIKMFKSRFIKV